MWNCLSFQNDSKAPFQGMHNFMTKPNKKVNIIETRFLINTDALGRERSIAQYANKPLKKFGNFFYPSVSHLFNSYLQDI